MTIAPQSLALVLVVAYLLGLLTGGIIALSIAMRAVKRAEGMGYER